GAGCPDRSRNKRQGRSRTSHRAGRPRPSPYRAGTSLGHEGAGVSGNYSAGKKANHIGRMENPPSPGRMENPSYDRSCRRNMVLRRVGHGTPLLSDQGSATGRPDQGRSGNYWLPAASRCQAAGGRMGGVVPGTLGAAQESLGQPGSRTQPSMKAFLSSPVALFSAVGFGVRHRADTERRDPRPPWPPPQPPSPAVSSFPPPRLLSPAHRP